MRRISPTKTAVAVGTVVGLWHVIWVTLVGVGWAKPVLDFILRLHFIQLQFELAPYSATTAATLVILTFAIGAFFGLVFACGLVRSQSLEVWIRFIRTAAHVGPCVCRYDCPHRSIHLSASNQEAFLGHIPSYRDGCGLRFLTVGVVWK